MGPHGCMEIVLAMTDHEGGEHFHGRRSMNMQVQKHGIREPASDEVNDVSVHTCVEEVHHVKGENKSSGDILGKEDGGGSQETDFETKGIGDVRGSDMVPHEIILVGQEGGVHRGSMLTQMDQLKKQRFSGEECIVNYLGVDDDISTHAIILSGKFQHVECGGLQIFGEGGEGVDV